MKKLGLYEWSIILFFIIAPLAAISIEVFILHSTALLITITLKWYVFFGVGLRLGGAGLKQILQPEFTAKEIFKVKDNTAFSLVRELGFANVCFGIIGIISLFVPSFRVPAAIAGGLYFGLAGLMHLFKPKDSNEEAFAMYSDIFIFIVLAILVATSLV